MASIPWEAADLETLKILWPKGDSMAEIAAAMDWRHTRNAVCGMANRLIGRGLLAPREANNHEWRARMKAQGKQYAHRTKPLAGLLRQPPTKPEPLPKAKAADIAPIGPIGEFEPGMTTCRWPYERDGVIQWCGHPGFPWCSHHQAIAWAGSHPRSQS